MSPAAKAAREKVRAALDNAVEKLSNVEYRDVLEELDVDIEGRLTAISEEGKLAEDE